MFIKKNGRRFDYLDKNLRNPYFENREKPIRASRSRQRLKMAAIASIPVIVLSALFFLATDRDFFSFKDVAIIGNDRLATDEILSEINSQISEERRFLFFRQDNIVFMDAASLAQRIKTKFSLSDVRITKKYLSRKLSVLIQEKTFAAVWMEAGKYLYLDASGQIVGQAAALEVNTEEIPLIENVGEAKFENADPGQSLPGGEKSIGFVSLIHESAKSRNDLLRIEKYRLDQDPLAIVAKTTDGPEIYFNIEKSAEEQLDRLAALIKSALQSGLETKKYIDLRYGELIYYR